MNFLKKIPSLLNPKSFSIRVISTFTSQIVNLALITSANIIIARQLGPSGKGSVTISLLVPLVLSTICHMGIGSANTYYGIKDESLTRTLFVNSLIYAIVVSIFMGFLYFFFMPLYGGLWDDGLSYQYLTICFWIFPLNLMWGYMGSILLAKRRIHELAAGRIIHNITYLLLIIIFVSLLKYKVAAVLIAMLFAYSAEMLWDLNIIKKYIHLKIKKDIPLFKKQILFGIKGHIGNLLDFVNSRMDMFLVLYFLNTAQVGIYSISVLLAELIFYIPSAVSTVLFPIIAASSHDHANRFTPEVCRHTFFWSVILAIVLAVMAKPIVQLLFTTNFIDSILPLWLLLPGIVSLSINRVISADLIGRGKPILTTYSTGIAAFFTILLDIILIPLWHVPGAAIASSCAYLISTLFITYFFLKESGAKLRELLVPISGDVKFYSRRLKSLFVLLK